MEDLGVDGAYSIDLKAVRWGNISNRFITLKIR